MKRHTILLFGLLIFFGGIQFRMVESFTLSDFSSRLIAVTPTSVESSATPGWSRKVVEPPRWLGLALMSVGSVLTLRSMKPPKVSFGS